MDGDESGFSRHGPPDRVRLAAYQSLPARGRAYEEARVDAVERGRQDMATVRAARRPRAVSILVILPSPRPRGIARGGLRHRVETKGRRVDGGDRKPPRVGRVLILRYYRFAHPRVVLVGGLLPAGTCFRGYQSQLVNLLVAAQERLRSRGRIHGF